MNYIIGDLHANIKEFKKLLHNIDLKKNDTLIFLGDYIDKNIYTREIINLLEILAQKYSCVFIKGNHDFVWDRYLNHQEFSRQNFLLHHGGVEALKQFSDEPEKLIKTNNSKIIKKYLQSYLKLIPSMIDYFIINNYIATHAGIMESQINQKPLEFIELNYFLRPAETMTEKKYLHKYTIVAGHTYLDTKPTIKNGYINIDLGAGYNGYLGCLGVEKKIIITSNNKLIKL